MTEKYVTKKKTNKRQKYQQKSVESKVFLHLLLYTIKVAKSRKPHAQRRVVIMNACTYFSRLHGVYTNILYIIL